MDTYYKTKIFQYNLIILNVNFEREQLTNESQLRTPNLSRSQNSEQLCCIVKQCPLSQQSQKSRPPPVTRGTMINNHQCQFLCFSRTVDDHFTQ